MPPLVSNARVPRRAPLRCEMRDVAGANEWLRGGYVKTSATRTSLSWLRYLRFTKAVHSMSSRRISGVRRPSSCAP
jgi:hypothetical protein